MQATGFRLASVIVDSLIQRTNLSYDELVAIIYPLCESMGKEQQVGDWLELPNGTTYTLTFNPAKEK